MIGISKDREYIGIWKDACVNLVCTWTKEWGLSAPLIHQIWKHMNKSHRIGMSCLLKSYGKINSLRLAKKSIGYDLMDFPTRSITLQDPYRITSYGRWTYDSKSFFLNGEHSPGLCIMMMHTTALLQSLEYSKSLQHGSHGVETCIDRLKS